MIGKVFASAQPTARARVRLMSGMGVSVLALVAGAPALAQVQPAPSNTAPPVAVDRGTEALTTALPRNTGTTAPNTADTAAPPSAAPVAAGQDGTVPATGPQGNTVSEVVVTGIRASLQSAQAIKQRSDVIVDSISSEDIGALPDRSVTEALQRVPGVSIDHFAGINDPDHFSTEGSGVVVRGLTYTRSEFNGRDAFTANNGQGLSFADVPAELMGGVDVFKSQSADMIEGGIAGTVNLRTRVPFDSKGPVLAFSLEENYGDFANRASPTGTIVASDRWNTPFGDFGVLADYVHSELYSRSDAIQIANFGQRTLYSNGNVLPNLPTDAPGAAAATPVGQVYLPRGADFREDQYDRTREGVGGAVQWRSPDHTMLATLQFLRSDAKEAWTEHAVEIATDNVTSGSTTAANGFPISDSFGVPGTGLSFDKDGLFQSGTITGVTGWRGDQYTSDPQDVRTPIYGLQSNNYTRGVLSDDVTNDFGANFKWNPTDNIQVNLDYQHTTATVDDLDVELLSSSYQNAAIALHGSDYPTVNFLPPSANGMVQQCPAAGVDANNCPTYFNAPHNSYSDPYNYFPRAAMDHIEQSEGEENAVRLDVDYAFGGDDDFFKSMRVGYRYSDRDETTRYSAYNWGVITEQWGANGPVWLTDPVDGVPTPGSGAYGTNGAPVANNFSPFAFDNFMQGQTPLPTGPESRLFYNGNPIKGYSQLTALALQVGDEWRARRDPSTGFYENWVPLAMRDNVVAGTPFLPSEINPVDETTHDAYVMFRYGYRFSPRVQVTGNFGLRYVHTTRAAQGYYYFGQQVFNCSADNIANSAAAAPTGFCQEVIGNGTEAAPQNPQLLQQATNFANGALIPNNVNTSYDYYLPSFNANFKVDSNKIVRVGISQSIAPPDIGLVRSFYNVSLQTSDQYLSIEGRPIGFFTVGNPLLKPVSADNYDISLEWYFGKVGQLSLAGFYKNLYNVVTNTTATVPLTNNGATFDAVVTTPTNSTATGSVKGFEVDYQQVFTFLPWIFNGLGLNANFTYVDSQGVPQNTIADTSAGGTTIGANGATTTTDLIANVDTSKLPLQGLSKYTYNLQGFYEKGPLSLRLAWSWRSRYLETVRDVIVPYAPIMADDYGQLDASAFYSITKNIKIGVQAVNLTDQPLKTLQVLNNDLLLAPRSWFLADRRYTVSLRANF